MSYEIQVQHPYASQDTVADAAADACKRDLALAKRLFDAGYFLLAGGAQAAGPVDGGDGKVVEPLVLVSRSLLLNEHAWDGEAGAVCQKAGATRCRAVLMSTYGLECESSEEGDVMIRHGHLVRWQRWSEAASGTREAVHDMFGPARTLVLPDLSSLVERIGVRGEDGGGSMEGGEGGEDEVSADAHAGWLAHVEGGNGNAGIQDMGPWTGDSLVSICCPNGWRLKDEMDLFERSVNGDDDWLLVSRRAPHANRQVSKETYVCGKRSLSTRLAARCTPTGINQFCNAPATVALQQSRKPSYQSTDVFDFLSGSRSAPPSPICRACSHRCPSWRRI